MTNDKDSGNISKDGSTGLKSKAYFLISLENSIAKLALPNPSPDAGIVAIYLANAPQDNLVDIAKLVDCRADYATHYKDKNADIVAGIYEGSEAPISAISMDLQTTISELFPKLKFGIAHTSIQKDGEAEKALEKVARNSYDAMTLQRPAV